MDLLRCRVRPMLAVLLASPLTACSEGPTAPVVSEEPLAIVVGSEEGTLDGFESGSVADWTSWSASGAWVSVETASPGALGSRYALRANYSASSTALVQREYTTPRDWSGSTAFEFQFYGGGTGNPIRLEIKDNGSSSPSAELFEYRFVDDFRGWKTLRVSWDRFVRRADWQPAGAPNDGFGRTAVWGYRFQPLKGSGSFQVDEIGLSSEPAEVEVVDSPSACSAAGALRVVEVSTASQLSSALAGARPGDLIRLADGVYSGSFRASVSGTADRRITLCGSSDAVLRGSSTGSGYGFYLNASHWTLRGFTVTHSQFGVYLVGASHNVLDGLTVTAIGQEAVRFRSFSSDNVLKNSRISDTGLLNPEYGEGVYIGSWKGHWTANSGGRPDASDRNRIENNVFGPDVRAEHIDAKEGTTGGVIRGNSFDGQGMVRSQSWVDSWVELKGNGYLVEANAGSRSLNDGFQVAVELAGWGNGNVFRNNSVDLGGGQGYGFRIGDAATGNVVGCDNRVANAPGGLSNVACQ